MGGRPVKFSMFISLKPVVFWRMVYLRAIFLPVRYVRVHLYIDMELDDNLTVISTLEAPPLLSLPAGAAFPAGG